MFRFHNFAFKLRGLKHKISKLVIKEIQEKQDNLNKSHPRSSYNANNDKNKKQCLMHFDPDSRIFVLSKWHKIQLCVKFSSVIFIYLTPFSQLKVGLIGCMILMKDYVCLPTAAMKMVKIYFYSDHNDSC